LSGCWIGAFHGGRVSATERVSGTVQWRASSAALDPGSGSLRLPWNDADDIDLRSRPRFPPPSGSSVRPTLSNMLFSKGGGVLLRNRTAVRLDPESVNLSADRDLRVLGVRFRFGILLDFLDVVFFFFFTALIVVPDSPIDCTISRSSSNATLNGEPAFGLGP